MAFNRNYSGGGGYRKQYKQQKKKSGCKLGRSKNDSPIISGWNVSKQRGFITLLATILDETVKSKSRDYKKAVCNITFKDRGSKMVTSGFYNEQSKKLYIPELSMVASINAPNGGYFGTVKVSR